MVFGRVWGFVGVFVVAGLVACGGASADFGFAPGSVSFSATEAPSAEQLAAGEPGPLDLQAGSHPWQVTASFLLNTRVNELGRTIPDGDLKDVLVELPPGLVGNVTVVPQCSIKQFETLPEPGFQIGSTYGLSGASCSASTQVGVADVRLRTSNFLGNQWYDVYNLVPPPGSPAQFGISPLKIPIIFRPTVRTGSDYGLTVAASNIPQFEPVGGTSVTFWGVPADVSHDRLRGECLKLTGAVASSLQVESPAGSGEFGDKHCPTDTVPEPFLTLPEECSSPLSVVFRADSWQHPGAYKADGSPDFSDPAWVRSEAQMPQLQGCEQPAFAPSLGAAADTSASDSPAGLTVEVKNSQDGLVNPSGIAAAAIRETTVALPAGISINPGQAAGLQACQASEDGLGSELEPSCPSGSRVGSVQITSPLLRDSLQGGVYVLQSNPPNVQLLIAASADGVNVKLLANVHLDEGTGQITTTLQNLPPLPVSDFKLSFSGGAQAALVTPPACGSYTTSALFVPSSTPFISSFPYTSAFDVSSGPGGGACSSPLPFAPVLTAGSTSDRAGAYTGFSLLLQRGDGQQRIGALQFRTPPGLSGMISQVPLCPEPQASQGTCPAASQIGHTVVTAGPGPYPLVVPQPGQPPAPIYLTGPYRGAPYGLSIAVPVIAGPFDLGRKVVRAAIMVDRHTAQLTISTDPAGSAFAIPSILDGIPTDLRTINAVVDRPGFMFNPTNCTADSFSGTATSTQNTTTAVSTRFEVGSCAGLAFKPAFKVSTSGKTSRKNGASLNVSIDYANIKPPAGLTTGQANIKSVKVDLPKQLPSRLTTLQKACLASVFEANPANCPKASLVGSAVVHTPILPVALTGPAYFVSHGGEAFPSLIIVLQGYGIRVDLIGTTFISSKSITSSTFKSVPDVPFTTFQLTLPKGPYSALTANGNLCTSKLAMPTAFTAQNGAVIHQNTPITTTNCPKHKPKKPAKKTNTSHTTSHAKSTSLANASQTSLARRSN